MSGGPGALELGSVVELQYKYIDEEQNVCQCE